MSRETVLGKALITSDALGWKAAQVLGGSLFVAVAAQVSVPMFPVPMTLQTLAILLVGFTLGSRMGALALLTYLAEGAAGLPVFANGASTAALFGPTAGFLIGFVGLAWLAGFAAEKGATRNVFLAAAAGIVPSALLYIPGLAVPALAFGKTMDVLWMHWMSPFLIGDTVKAVLAALIVTGALKALKGAKA